MSVESSCCPQRSFVICYWLRRLSDAAFKSEIYSFYIGLTCDGRDPLSLHMQHDDMALPFGWRGMGRFGVGSMYSLSRFGCRVLRKLRGDGYGAGYFFLRHG